MELASNLCFAVSLKVHILYELNAILYELKCILYELKAFLYELKAVLDELKCISYELNTVWYELKCIGYELNAVWQGRRPNAFIPCGLAGTGREDSRIVRVSAVIQCDIRRCFTGVQHLGVNSLGSL